MAKYKSLVELSGSIGDLVFYNLNGTPVVRRKSGFSKEGYESNPKYQKVRENSQEFGHCSKSGKLIRKSLEDFIGDCEDKYLYQKFAKVMTQIKDLDTKNEKGKRRIEIGLQNPKAYELLADFQFGKFPKLEGISLDDAFFTKSLSFKDKPSGSSVQLITMKPDFVNLNMDLKEQTLDLQGKKQVYEFDTHFGDDNAPLLYFLVIKSKDEILNAGFLA